MSTTYSDSGSRTDLEWPPHFERTPPGDRSRTSRFDKTLRQSVDDLADELGRGGVESWRLSTDAEHQKRNPKYPYSDATPDDPGAVVYWTKDGDQFAAACDHYTRLRDNIRSLYYYIQEKRKMRDRPVVTGESEFSNLRLPSAGEDAVAGDAPAHAILGVDRDADSEAVREAFREQAHEQHPDSADGDMDAFMRLKDAKNEMLQD